MSLFGGLFKKKDIAILSYVEGTVIPMSKVKDDVFANNTLGEGVAIVPTGSKFFAPIDGELVTVFPTKHAIGIKHKSGVQVLLHIGVDTVNLKGEGFTSHVKQGDMVKAGDLLVTVDWKKVKDKVPSIDSPLIVMRDSLESTSRKLEILKTNGSVKVGTEMAIIK